MPNLDALILDYGGVLCREQPAASLEALARCASTTAERWHEAYWRYRGDYDLGLPAAEYWQRVLHELGHDGASQPVSASLRLVAQLIDLDVASWVVYREEVWEIARDFRARGGRVGMLSNGVPEIMSRIRADRPLDDWFDTVVVSYELGVSKPHPAIYQAGLQRLDVTAPRALFVDDRRENIDAAAQLGLRTLHFTGDESVQALREVSGVRGQGSGLSQETGTRH
ncbi:MAG: HAD-IA family hydrolase [Luteitalea sp.]|nr:HAD-IA family hydrolase [Luteitalea sp.]